MCTKNFHGKNFLYSMKIAENICVLNFHSLRRPVYFYGILHIARNVAAFYHSCTHTRYKLYIVSPVQMPEKEMASCNNFINVHSKPTHTNLPLHPQKEETVASQRQ